MGSSLDTTWIWIKGTRLENILRMISLINRGKEFKVLVELEELQKSYRPEAWLAARKNHGGGKGLGDFQIQIQKQNMRLDQINKCAEPHLSRQVDDVDFMQGTTDKNNGRLGRPTKWGVVEKKGMNTTTVTTKGVG